MAILDDLTASAVLAVSLRKIRSAYSGYCIKIRRSSDSNEVDVSFDSNDTISADSSVNPTTWGSTLSAFAGNNDCFVTTWYDQSSGTAYNLANTSTAGQPQIILGGAILIDTHGKPWIYNSSQDRLFTTSGATWTQPNTISTVSKWDSTASTNAKLFDGETASNRNMVYNVSGDFRFFAGTAVSIDTTDTNHSMRTFLFDGSSSKYWENGTQVGTTYNTGTSSLQGLVVGGTYDRDSHYMDGKYQEFIVFNSDIGTTDREALETDQNAYWLSDNNLWKPSDITTEVWLDASDTATLTKNGDDVTQWDDKSGNNYYYTQTAGSYAPHANTRALNAKNVVDFDGSNDYLKLTSGYQADDDCIIAIVAIDDRTTYSGADTGRIFQAQVGDGTRFSVYIIPSASGNLAFNKKTGYDPHLETFETGTKLIVAYDTGGNIDVGYNATYGGTSYRGEDFATLSRWYLGVYNGGETAESGHLDGAIAEIVYVKGTYALDTREKLEGYLAHKWGLEGDLPSGHPYKSSAPTSGNTQAVTNTIDASTSFTKNASKIISSTIDISTNILKRAKKTITNAVNVSISVLTNLIGGNTVSITNTINASTNILKRAKKTITNAVNVSISVLTNLIGGNTVNITNTINASTSILKRVKKSIINTVDSSISAIKKITKSIVNNVIISTIASTSSAITQLIINNISASSSVIKKTNKKITTSVNASINILKAIKKSISNNVSLNITQVKENIIGAVKFTFKAKTKLKNWFWRFRA